MMISQTVLSVVVCAGAIVCFGQAETPLAKVRSLNLPTLDGRVPAIYSPMAKARAARYQATIVSAHNWYEDQLGVRVQVTLALLDREDWERATSVPYPMANSKPGLVTLPARMEDFPGFAEMGADADILAETISFHEIGHLFAAKEGIRSANSWINELIANIFVQEYIGAHQPALLAYLPSAHRDFPTPRYTSLADLDYLSDAVSFSNYAWFQFQLNQLAFEVAQKHELRQVVERLKIAFPAAKNEYLPEREAIRRMETISAGFTESLGPLSQPATIRTVEESVCANTEPGEDAATYLVIDNRRSSPIVVSQSGKSPVSVAAGEWRRLSVRAGEQLQLSHGSCLIASNEPAVAVVNP